VNYNSIRTIIFATFYRRTPSSSPRDITSETRAFVTGAYKYQTARRFVFENPATVVRATSRSLTFVFQRRRRECTLIFLARDSSIRSFSESAFRFSPPDTIVTDRCTVLETNIITVPAVSRCFVYPTSVLVHRSIFYNHYPKTILRE